MCKGLETCKHTTYLGSDKVIGEFGGTEWMEGIIVVDDGHTAQWKDLWWSLGAAEGETPIRMGVGPLLAQKVSEMGKRLGFKRHFPYKIHRTWRHLKRGKEPEGEMRRRFLAMAIGCMGMLVAG